MSAEIYNVSLTPTVSSRASSRQKNCKSSYKKIANNPGVVKLVVVVLDKIRDSVVNRRVYESFYKIKMVHEQLYKPAPSPSG